MAIYTFVVKIFITITHTHTICMSYKLPFFFLKYLMSLIALKKKQECYTHTLRKLPEMFTINMIAYFEKIFLKKFQLYYVKLNRPLNHDYC